MEAAPKARNADIHTEAEFLTMTQKSIRRPASQLLDFNSEETSYLSPKLLPFCCDGNILTFLLTYNSTIFIWGSFQKTATDQASGATYHSINKGHLLSNTGNQNLTGQSVDFTFSKQKVEPSSW